MDNLGGKGMLAPSQIIGGAGPLPPCPHPLPTPMSYNRNVSRTKTGLSGTTQRHKAENVKIVSGLAILHDALVYRLYHDSEVEIARLA